jgi:hypothetical protein
MSCPWSSFMRLPCQPWISRVFRSRRRCWRSIARTRRNWLVAPRRTKPRDHTEHNHLPTRAHRAQCFPSTGVNRSVPAWHAVLDGSDEAQPAGSYLARAGDAQCDPAAAIRWSAGSRFGDGRHTSAPTERSEAVNSRPHGTWSGADDRDTGLISAVPAGNWQEGRRRCADNICADCL